jgi:hypothetical protein
MRGCPSGKWKEGLLFFVTAQVGRRYRPKRRQAEERGSFFEKRTKKLLTFWAERPGRAEVKTTKSFLLLFSKRTS